MVICDWDGLDENIAQCAAAIASGKKAIMPFALLGLVDDPALHKAAAKIYADAEFPRSTALGAIPRRAAGEKIRIGYYSADFHHHATSFLIAEMLERMTPPALNSTASSFGPERQDEMRRRISAAFDQLHRCPRPERRRGRAPVAPTQHRYRGRPERLYPGFAARNFRRRAAPRCRFNISAIPAPWPPNISTISSPIKP